MHHSVELEQAGTLCVHVADEAIRYGMPNCYY